MVSENFKNLKELYLRIAPALKSKVKELKGKGYSFITEKDLWNYLKNTKWCNELDLTLYDIVNDIFYIEEKELLSYLAPINRLETNILEDEDMKIQINEEDTIL